MLMFATGIENRCPSIEQGRVRVNEMESCGPCQQWRLDLEGNLMSASIEEERFGPYTAAFLSVFPLPPRPIT